MDFFTHLISSIGNSLFGGGNNNNVSSNDQKRKRDQQQPGFNANPSISTPSTNLSAATPSAPRVIKPKALGPDLSGLSDSDAATAKDLISRGKNATGFITAARDDAVAKNNARIANDPVNKVLNTGVEVAKTAVIDPVVNTAKSLGDMGVATFGDVTGNRRLSQEGKRNFERDFEGSIGGMILNPLKTIGTSAAAALAGRDLLNKGYDPDIVRNAMDAYTAPNGVSTTQSNAQNALAIGSAAGQTAFNLAGADAILRPKPIRVGAADEAAADLANVADEVPVVPKVETAPVEPVPVEAGVKPPKVAPAVKTPTEVVANTPAPVEAGVKAPNLVTATVPGGTRSRMPAVETQPITSEVARAEAAAQQVVDKAADNVPQSNPTAVEAAPVETAGQAASKEAATNTPSSLPADTSNRALPKGEREKFRDQAREVNDIGAAVMDRTKAGDFSGARRALDRIIDNPEYGQDTVRGNALVERAKKLGAAIKREEDAAKIATAPKVETPQPTHRTWQELMNKTEKPLIDYKVGDKVTTDTMYGQVTGKITKVPNFSEDIRIKNNSFKIKLDEPLKLPNGRKSPDTITADGRHFSTEGKAMSIDDPTAALKQEALKYKSAEEFIYEKGLEHPEYKRRVAENEKYINEVLKPARAEANSASRAMQAMEKKYVGKKNLKLTDAEKVKIEAEYKELGDKVRKAQELEDNLPYNYPDEGINREKDLTDLYNQAHAEATPTPKQEGKAMSIDDPTAPREIPVIEHDRSMAAGKPSVKGRSDARYNTEDENLDRIGKSSLIAVKGTAKTADAHASELANKGFSNSDVRQMRNWIVKNADANGHYDSKSFKSFVEGLLNKADAPQGITDKQFADAGIPDFGDAPKTPGDAPAVGKLGTITRDAVHDGSINTPEGQQAMLAKTEAAATAEAKEAGTTIEDIIRKGQQAWQKSRETGKDLTTKEAESLVKGFTPEQQRVYKAYAQEISTLRDRSGLSLDGGYQGEWYGPRQALVDGESAAFDPRMINEISRKKGGGVLGEELDVSTTPHQQAIQRYADSPAASARTVIETAETNPETGAARNINIPDKAKEELEDAMKDVVAKRDEASRLVRDGDKTGADKLEKEINDTIDDAFKKFIDSIPGGGSDRRAAISDIKALRGTYKQVTTQSLGLSNVFNRIADQGTKAVLGATRPIAQRLEKAFSDHFARMGNADSMKLNTSKEARQAAKEFASGTLWNEIRANFKANMKLAGAGKNPVLSAVDKIDSFINSTATAATQAGDVSTQVMRKTLELGLSRPEAQGLKTVDEYKQYLAKYIKTNEFKKDLDSVGSDILPRIGLAGGDDAVRGGGRISAGLSKYLDNGIRTIAEAKGIKDNRLIEELNGYVKGNLTGYAGVGSRVFSTVKDAAIGTKWRRAGEIAKSGDPEAVARATQMAAQGVADSIALYGSAGAAVMAATMAPGFIGYTGAPEKMGSSSSAYNKDNNIPANQWYINLGGKRVYFDPSRPLGAPGVAANIGGSIATGKDLVSSIGNSVSQLYNQAGGSSLPDNIVNVASLFNPATPDADRQYASERVQSMLAPSTGILNNVANWIDPVKRAPDNFVDYIKANLPGFRSDVPVAKTSAGDPVANSKQISGGSALLSFADNPAAESDNGEVSLDAEISRLQKLTGDVYPTKANTNADNGKTQAFAKLLINDPAYAALDDKAKAEQMKNVLNGTSTKDINDKLSDTDKMALLSHKLQGNKADVWLEDNTNNLNYLQAKYNNESANGTLKAIDKSMAHEGSLAQQLAIARVNAKNNVPQDVVGAYGDTSKSEFYDLPDGEEKNMLMAYDKALADAGLPSKYQNKYGQYASGSGGSRLPSPGSLVIQPKQIGALSPDTTPVEYKMPSLQTYTPGGKVNPYIRSISTSKGVK